MQMSHNKGERQGNPHRALSLFLMQARRLISFGARQGTYSAFLISQQSA